MHKIEDYIYEGHYTTVDDMLKKPTAVAHIGSSLDVMLYDITFTKKQIKNFKKYFNITIKNLGEINDNENI